MPDRFDNLKDKSETEIRFAASLWFTCQEAYIAGDVPPESVFAISVKDPSEDQLKRMRAMALKIEARTK